jgi:hypothetical protein
MKLGAVEHLAILFRPSAVHLRILTSEHGGLFCNALTIERRASCDAATPNGVFE